MAHRADTLPAMTYMKMAGLVILGSFAAAFAGGCASYRHLQIEPSAKNGAIVAPVFTESYYSVDREKTLTFVMRSRSVDKATGKSVEQFASFRVFWRPVGGRTTMDPSALNATYRYVLITPDSLGMYEGAGFVRLWGKDGIHRLNARLMDGDLRLTEATSNFVDTLGRSRIRGNFHATFDDAKALDMLVAEQREFFSRSLKTQATTMPAATTSRPADVNFPMTSMFPDTAPATMPAGAATQPWPK